MARRTVLALAVGCLALAACGGSNSDSDAAGTPAPTAAPDTTPATTDAPATTPAPTEPATTPAPTEAPPTAPPTTPAPTDPPTTVAAPGSLVDALAAEMLQEEDGLIEDPDEAQCWASGVIAGVGEDRLTELGMTPDDIRDVDEYAFTEAEAGAIVESLFDCVDVRAAFATVFEADFGPEGAACIANGLDEEMVTLMLSSSIAGDSEEPPAEFIEAFTQIAAFCGIAP